MKSLVALAAATIALTATPPAAAAKRAPHALDADATRLSKAARRAGMRGTFILGTASDHFTLLMGIGSEGMPVDRGDATWRWASVTKQVVAVLAMQEVERGALALDTPIAAYLPDLAVASRDRVTVRQLLQHSAGLPNPEDGPKDAQGRVLRYLASEEPVPPPGVSPACLGASKRAPGEAFEYNNCDYEVLGAILERTSGKPLAQLIAERVTTPLGMTGTRLQPPGTRLTTAVGPDPRFRDDGQDEARYGAAAGMVGPAIDLWRFDVALMGGRLLKPESMAELWRGDPRLGYAALGQWSYEVALKGCASPQRIVERRGEIGYVQVRNLIAPERGRVVIAFANHPVDFGEPWQGKGLTYELMSAALCPD